MAINFEWNNVSLSAEQKAEIEEDIRAEIPDALPPGIGRVIVSLWGNTLMSELEGTAADASRNALVSIRYSLTSQRQTTYQPLQAK